MSTKSRSFTFSVLLAIFLMLFISACGTSAPSTSQQASSTATPTALVLVEPATPTTAPSRCEGLAGELEIQVLVGPSEAVGLTPYAVGSIPFVVTKTDGAYLIEGSGSFDFADGLGAEWGTFEVTMEMSGTIEGTCIADDQTEELDVFLEMTGSQQIIVTVDGYSQTFPWEGTLPFDLTFPIEEGAVMEGEGYAIVLHLK